MSSGSTLRITLQCEREGGGGKGNALLHPLLCTLCPSHSFATTCALLNGRRHTFSRTATPVFRLKPPPLKNQHTIRRNKKSSFPLALAPSLLLTPDKTQVLSTQGCNRSESDAAICRRAGALRVPLAAGASRSPLWGLLHRFLPLPPLAHANTTTPRFVLVLIVIIGHGRYALPP